MYKMADRRQTLIFSTCCHSVACYIVKNKQRDLGLNCNFNSVISLTTNKEGTELLNGVLKGAVISICYYRQQSRSSCSTYRGAGTNGARGT